MGCPTGRQVVKLPCFYLLGSLRRTEATNGNVQNVIRGIWRGGSGLHRAMTPWLREFRIGSTCVATDSFKRVRCTPNCRRRGRILRQQGGARSGPAAREIAEDR